MAPRAGGLRIASRAAHLEEGLFGQVLLWVFELLPWLESRGLRPEWDVCSLLYSEPASRPVLPGVFDLAYEPAAARRSLSLLRARVLHTSVLGGDWAGTHALWSRFFVVPARIAAQADAVALPPGTLGLHYRGTDKNRQSIDTNAVSVDDFLTLAHAFVAEHPEVAALFVASDEPGVLERVRERFPALAVHGLGDVPFHKADVAAGKADRALLDCVLLSRCRWLLKCSSALSGFAKVLNPGLDCHRVSACKLFGDVPYFPDAYVPRLSLRDPTAAAILARQFAGDWLDDPAAARWTTPFVSRPRFGPWQKALRALKYAVTAAMGRPRKA